MHAFQRNLIALALAAAFASPVAFSQGKSDAAPSRASNPTAAPARINPPASDAISERTTKRETAPPTTSNSSAHSADTQAGGMSATATTAPPGKGDWWKDADSDADGKISRIEATANAGLSSRFDTVDANKDGMVTQDEYRSYFTTQASQGSAHAATHSVVFTNELWTRLDANSDTRLSAAEAAANLDLTGAFSVADSDGDAFITLAEYRAYARTQK